jgi:hypothetical protein
MADQTMSVQTGDPKNGPATERRAWVRFRSDQDIICQQSMNCPQEEANTGWLGRVLDVSVSGIAMNLRRRFPPGTALNVELATKADGSRRFAVKVVRATQELNGRWIIGCSFMEPLGEQELRDFIAEGASHDE